jgi:hypothetical protein
MFGVGQISFGGRQIGTGFALSGDSVWESLSRSQQTWVMDTLVKLDSKIRSSTGTTCPTFGPSVTAAGGCFQAWFNSNYKGLTALTDSNGTPIVLRTDGVFDQATLDALRTVVGMDPASFPAPYPGLATEKKKLSTGAMVGIAAGGAVVLGGVVYLATRKPRRKR